MPYGTIDGQINAAQTTGAGGNNTTSTTLVSTGLGLSIGSSYTGRYLVFLTGSLSNSVAGDGVVLSIVRFTSIPGNGVAASGTVVASTAGTSATANALVPLTAVVLDTGGSGNVVYYAAFESITGGTTTISSSFTLTLTVVEI